MQHICVSNLTTIGSHNGLVLGWRQANYLNQWWNIVNWSLTNRLQWNFNQNSYTFMEENIFESAVCKMTYISSQHQCVKYALYEDDLPGFIHLIFQWLLCALLVNTESVLGGILSDLLLSCLENISMKTYLHRHLIKSVFHLWLCSE